MDGYSCPSTVMVPIHRVASALALEGEAVTLKKADKIVRGKLWEARRHTSTRTVEVLTSSDTGSPRSIRASMWRRIASRINSNASVSVSPSV